MGVHRLLRSYVTSLADTNCPNQCLIGMQRGHSNTQNIKHMRNFTLHKFLAMLLMAVSSATLSVAQNVAKIGSKEYATLEEAVNSVAQGKYGYIKMLADASFDNLSIDGKRITINLQAHTVKGNSIAVNGVEGVDTYLKILDSKAKGLSVDAKNNYKVSYTTSGTLELTGSIRAYNGAGIKVESGTVVSTKNTALFAVGDVTGQKDITSYINITGGYVKAQELVPVLKDAKPLSQWMAMP